MALNGFVSAEDRATRLVKTSAGFVVAIRRNPQVYEIRRDGVHIGEVRKFRSWFAYSEPPHGMSGTGNDEPRRTRLDAIEVLLSIVTPVPLQAEPQNSN